MKGYPGNKGCPGVLEALTNMVPRSSRYFSLFYGGGGLESSRYFKGVRWMAAEKDPDQMAVATADGQLVVEGYAELLTRSGVGTGDFVFADPPYLFSERRSGRRYYDHEFDRADHAVFLDRMTGLAARVLITHPACELYDTALAGWRKSGFSYMTRAGWYHDCMYMNYDPSSLPLHTYACLGRDHTHRQQIQRKRSNMLKKLRELPYHQRAAILEGL